MFTRYVYNEVNIPINNIAISVETNTAKAYNRNSILRIQYCIHNNLAEAINAKTSNTIYICAYDGIYGTLTFCQLNEQNGGIYRFKTMYGSKVNAFWHKRMLVCYDGNKSLECVKPFFDEWADGGIRQVDILQFCLNKDFFYQEDMNNDYNRLNKTILHFLSKDRLYLSRSNITYRNGGLGGQVYYQPAKGRKITGINLAFKAFNQNNYFAEFVVPVGEQEQHLIALDHIAKMIRAKMNTNHTIDVNLAFTEYKATMFESIEAQEDVLAKWYKDRPEVQEWQRQTILTAKQTGYTRTLMGRYRPLPDINSKNKWKEGHMCRAAINTPIQGGAADIVMMAMLKIEKDTRLKEIGYKLLLQIHDGKIKLMIVKNRGDFGGTQRIC